MSKIKGPPVIIFSASHDTDETLLQGMSRRDQMLPYLDKLGIEHAEVGGMYKGKREASLLCIADTDYKRKMIHTIAYQYEQRYVYEIDANRHCQLVDIVNETCEPLGPLVTSKSPPDGDYTYVHSTGNYFYCKGV